MTRTFTEHETCPCCGEGELIWENRDLDSVCTCVFGYAPCNHCVTLELQCDTCYEFADDWGSPNQPNDQTHNDNYERAMRGI